MKVSRYAHAPTRAHTDSGELGEASGGALLNADQAWLALYVVSGVGIGMSFELLQVHAGPAKYETFFLPLLGYWAQMLASAAWLLLSGALGRVLDTRYWNRRNVAALIVSACFDGAAQALNFVAQVQGGYMLFTIFSSSVTLFACVIASLLPWTPRLRPQQWCGVLSIVIGLMLTSIPNPIVARKSFALGLLCSALGSFCVACSYPICELVFRLAPRSSPPPEELACFSGSLVNVLLFTTWSLVYTLPRWQQSVVGPIYDSREPDVGWALVGYILFAVLVAVHALTFWKSVHRMGTVPTAVSKGAQQSAVFLCAHLLFCSSDPTECIWNNGRSHTLWSAWQKGAALACCCSGVMLYTLGKAKPRASPESSAQETLQQQLTELESVEGEPLALRASTRRADQS